MKKTDSLIVVVVAAGVAK